MTRAMLAAAALIAALCAPSAAIAQTTPKPETTMSSTMHQWWNMIERSFVAAAEAMPEEKWSFAPRDGAFEGARTFAEQVKHVACGNFAFFLEIEQKTPPADCGKGGPDPAKTKAELVKYLRESLKYAGEVLTRISPTNALDAAGGPYGGQSTRLGLTTLAVWHASDHYGQIVVYLRMNGIVPPASR